MVASGFAGLGYQIVWTQQGALWLGHETAAVLAVVTAFFCGLALGALTLGPRIERSDRPERWYAACEVLIALWGLTVALGLAPLSEGLLDLTGAQPTALRQWGIAFVGCFAVLLPATAAMGATLPAMARVTAASGLDGGGIAALYASNTAGAVLGVLATAFWLIPEFGLWRTAAVCASLNLVCAAAAWSLRGSSAARPPPVVASRSAGAQPLALLAATGALGIGYEVLVVRVLSQVAEDTVYTFALLLAVYLIGTSLGAALYQRFVCGRAEPARLRRRLLRTQAFTCLLGTLGLWGAEALQQAVLGALGPGMVQALASESAIAVMAFALPSTVMGALFSHLCREAQAAGHGVGRALGVNTLGAAAAPLLFGLLLVPALGAKAALLAVVAGYLLLALPRPREQPLFWATASALGALALWAPPLAFVTVPEGGHVARYLEGTMAAVSVVEDAGVARLRINNRQQEGSSATVLADSRQALLPLLLHEAPQHALFLGLGTGVTARAAAQEPALRVDAVELLPEVIAASAHFATVQPEPAAPLRMIAADARRYVRTSEQHYDVIVADNFHPARSGSGSLYTVEHFRAVRERLAERGLFCQWLPLHQLDLDTLRSIVRSFVAVNPGGWAMLATNSLETPVLGLVARRDGRPFDPVAIGERLAHATRARPLGDFGITDEWSLLGGFVAGPQALQRFAGDAPLNTDDRPVVAYRAPRITYAPDTLPRERLMALLGELSVLPQAVVGASADAAWSARLAAYWSARDQFLSAGQAVVPSADLHRMLAQVRAPLLDVLRTSPDFRPAYDPLLRMATALARSDPAAARSLLAELVQAQPARGEAWQLLAQLDGGALGR